MADFENMLSHACLSLRPACTLDMSATSHSFSAVTFTCRSSANPGRTWAESWAITATDAIGATSSRSRPDSLHARRQAGRQAGRQARTPGRSSLPRTPHRCSLRLVLATFVLCPFPSFLCFSFGLRSHGNQLNRLKNRLHFVIFVAMADSESVPEQLQNARDRGRGHRGGRGASARGGLVGIGRVRLCGAS